MRARSDSADLRAWNTARQVVLGGILAVGSVATAAASAQRLAELQVQSHVEVYSGIGVSIAERPDGSVEVLRVIASGPSDGEIFPGAILRAADGVEPSSLERWRDSLRGDPGTEVEVTVSYPGACTHSVVIERQVVRAWRH